MYCFSRSAAVMHNTESQTIADMTFFVLPNSVWRSIVFSCLSTSVFVFSARIFYWLPRSESKLHYGNIQTSKTPATCAIRDAIRRTVVVKAHLCCPSTTVILYPTYFSALVSFHARVQRDLISGFSRFTAVCPSFHDWQNTSVRLSVCPPWLCFRRLCAMLSLIANASATEALLMAANHNKHVFRRWISTIRTRHTDYVNDE